MHIFLSGYHCWLPCKNLQMEMNLNFKVSYIQTHLSRHLKSVCIFPRGISFFTALGCILASFIPVKSKTV